MTTASRSAYRRALSSRRTERVYTKRPPWPFWVRGGCAATARNQNLVSGGPLRKDPGGPPEITRHREHRGAGEDGAEGPGDPPARDDEVRSDRAPRAGRSEAQGQDGLDAAPHALLRPGARAVEHGRRHPGADTGRRHVDPLLADPGLALDQLDLAQRRLPLGTVARVDEVVEGDLGRHGEGHRLHQNRSPVSSSNASTYLARVRSTTAAGSGGGGSPDARSHPLSAEVSQLRTICLSYDGCARPGCHSAAGQNREEPGVSTSSASTMSPPEFEPAEPRDPNSSLLSARMMPRSRATCSARA